MLSHSAACLLMLLQLQETSASNSDGARLQFAFALALPLARLGSSSGAARVTGSRILLVGPAVVDLAWPALRWLVVSYSPLLCARCPSGRRTRTSSPAGPQTHHARPLLVAWLASGDGEGASVGSSCQIYGPVIRSTEILHCPVVGLGSLHGLRSWPIPGKPNNDPQRKIAVG